MARDPLLFYRPGPVPDRGAYADPFLMLHREMNRLFDDAFRGSQPGSGQGGREGGVAISPHMDVSETEGAVKIVAELPGVKQTDVEVTLDDDVLTIRGEKKSESRQEKANFHVSERSFGSFQRSIRLPFHIDPDQVRADFEHGVLTVTLPKGREQERTKRIQVGSGAGGASGGRAAVAGQQSGSGAGSGSGQAGQGSVGVTPGTTQGPGGTPAGSGG